MRTFRVAVPALAVGLAAFAVGVPESAAARPADGWSQGRDSQQVLTSYIRHENGGFDALPDVPGAETTAPVRLNDRGQVAGYYTTLEGEERVYLGYVYTPGDPEPFQTIDVDGAQLAIAADINNGGQVVGSYVDEGADCTPPVCPPYTQHAFRWEDGKVTVIDPPRTVNASIAYSINDNGQIVGVSEDENFIQLGFLWEDGRFTILDPAGSAQN